MAVIDGEKVSYSGRVVRTYAREERVMSDVYADVSYASVIEDDGSKTELYLRAHFECCSSTRYAVVDVTPEWKAYHEAHEALVVARVAHEACVLDAKAAAKPKAPVLPRTKKGDLVMVVGKIPGLAKGDIVEVVWAGTSNYSGAARVGVMVGGERIYCPASKVERVCSTEELEAADARAVELTEAHRESAARFLAEATEKLAAAEAAYEAARPVVTAVAA